MQRITSNVAFYALICLDILFLPQASLLSQF